MFINNDVFLTEVFFCLREREEDFQVQLKLNNFSQREKKLKLPVQITTASSY